uniref:Alpha-1,3-glucosyltransferase n=1 Tax=Globodera rostochiensis TaxID=31243 RepID=A0A914HDH2_GLORO
MSKAADFKFIPSKPAQSFGRFGKSKDQLGECARLATENGQLVDDRAALGLFLALFMLLQAVLSVANYSGYQSPPMFGDFEAQRHWMEIAVNLPPKDWYVNSSANDLNYWGLDYPPLTAYHSWLLGRIAILVEPSWVQLGDSRGSEGPRLKLFMRLSVVVTMSALFAPALVQLLCRQRTEEGREDKMSNNRDKSTTAFGVVGAALLFPGLLFVDCAHCQYNHCSLGLFLWAVASLEKGRLAAAAFLFVLALNHKQMELYHAMPIAVFMFTRSIVHTDKRRPLLCSAIGQSLLNLLALASVVAVTFAVLWSPFLWPESGLALQVLRRLFPFHRGLFEDKVANFWPGNLFGHKLGTLLVLFACVPSLICLCYRPNASNLRVALTSNALAFFLFSFQVHEKSILLATIPALLLLTDERLRRPTALFLNVSLFSLYPLCLKDGVAEVLLLFFAYPFVLRLLLNSQCHQTDASSNSDGRRHLLHSTLFWATLVPSFAICVFQLLVRPPARLPHLFPMLNALFSFGVFVVYWLYLNIRMVVWNWTVFIEQKGRKTVENKRKRQ